MRVAVIGAGLTGLAAIKCCRDEGFDVVCFDIRDDLGGIWNYMDAVKPGQASCTRSEIITLIILWLVIFQHSQWELEQAVETVF